jgi:hypothetical protein
LGLRLEACAGTCRVFLSNDVQILDNKSFPLSTFYWTGEAHKPCETGQIGHWS